MKIHIKRIYDEPSPSDGRRILVDRLWPRGVSKEHAHIAGWFKDAAPSKELRVWFHKDVQGRFDAFTEKYRAELKKNASLLKDYFSKHTKTVTLLTAAKDVDHSHVPVLAKFLSKLI
jgi:uncharacterized protein YeaO (DUF488 family)